MNIFGLVCTICVAMAFCSYAAPREFQPVAPQQLQTHAQKKEWFDSAKFGVFIHWNFSSIKTESDLTKHPYVDPNSPWYKPDYTLEKNELYKQAIRGTEISWGRIGPRPGKDNNAWDTIFDDHKHTKLPYAQYNLLYKQFKPEKLDASRWARAFRNGGVKYVTIVSKHHDGFPVFDAHQSLLMDENGYPVCDNNGHAKIAQGNTASTGWKITNPDSYGKDILRILSDAMRKEGLEVGFYYSNPDWTHPDYRVAKHNVISPEGVKRYVPYMKSHLKQLLTEYGDVLTIWFDGLGGSRPSFWGGNDTYTEVRGYSPSTLFNDRYYKGMGAPIKEDYYTPERRKGKFDVTRKWETCDIVHQEHTWSYMKDNAIRPWQDVLGDIIDVVDAGGNYLMNMGPDEHGVLTPEEYDLLDHIGNWIERHQEGFYNTKAGPFKPWGSLSSSHRGRTVYIHVRVNEQRSNQIQLPNVGVPIVSAEMLNGGAVPLELKGDVWALQLPKLTEEVIDTIKVTYESPLEGYFNLSGSGSERRFKGKWLSRNANYTINWRSPKQDKNGNNSGLLNTQKPRADYAFHSESMDNPSITIDLGSVKDAHTVFVMNRTGSSQMHAAGLTLEVSEDGTTYTKPWQDKSKGKSVPDAWTIPLETYKTGGIIPGKNLRYLRLSLPGKNRVLHLKSVQIYGK